MGRRGNGEGSIIRRKDGRWMGRYTVHTANGPKQKTIYGKTRQDVAASLAKAIADRDGGLYFEAENLTVSEYLKRWLNDSVKGSVRASTHGSYKRQVNRYIVPAIGRMKLKTLTRHTSRGCTAPCWTAGSLAAPCGTRTPCCAGL
jgi:integrase